MAEYGVKNLPLLGLTEEVYIKFIKILLTNRRTKLKFDDFTSESINVNNGIGQGDPLSMLLYILYNADLLEITDNDEYEDALGYVDDIALLAVGDSFEDTTARLQNLMEKRLQWSVLHNSRFEISKSAILHLSRKTTVDPEDVRNRIPLSRPQLTVSGQIIKEVLSYKYLGVQIDAQLNWKEQAQRAIANATKWLLQFRRLTRPSTGTSAELMRRLYLAVALPKITYGLDVWYTPPNKKAGQTKNSGSAAVLRQLQKTQRIATLAITGALRTTPTDFADVHAGVLPIELALLKATHRALTRLLTLPPTHPLHSIVTHTRNNPPRKHASSIANLLRIFKMNRTAMETIIPIAQCPPRARRPRFTIKIADSREDSIEWEKKDTADFKIFSDGSGMEGKIGAAAVLYTKERLTSIGHLKAFLGPPTKRNTYEAEAIGAILAVWLLSKCQETAGKRVSLFIDNQSVLASLSNPKATSGQYLIRHLILLANSLACVLSMHWISGHSKVRGNEKVDELAKEAASGRSSARVNLPQTLREPLPTSASATKQTFHNKMKSKWDIIWEKSDRSRRMADIDDEFPFNDFRRRTYLIPRQHASFMVQIRCGHISLNSYLHRINRSDTDLCQSCLQSEDNLHNRETIKHFLFECPSLSQEREELVAKIGRSQLNIRDIMKNADYMSALATFINRSGRFKE